MRLTDDLDQLILAAVCDDFMTLEFITDKILRPPGGDAGKYDAESVHSHLLQLISDKLINAYLLHADPPYITPINIGIDALGTSWFYITQRGRKSLGNTSRKQALVRRRGNSASPGEYTSAVSL